MILTFLLSNESQLYLTTARYLIIEKRDRYEVNSEAESAREQLRDISDLHEWLQSTKIKAQVFAAPTRAETIYIRKSPIRIKLEQYSVGMVN